MSSDYARWRPEFAKALDPARYTIEWVDAMLEAGHYVFDATDRAAIITEALVWPTGNWEVKGVCSAGDVSETINILIPLAEERARQAGAIGSVISSRRAWQRLLRNKGYDLYRTEIRKTF